MKTKKMAISAMFIAVGVLAGNIIYIPVGASKCFPVQHTLNILAAVFLGPAYGVINAFCISLLRNFMGTGSLLAFPGSMVGAFLAGMIYKMTKNTWATAVAEVVGTGVLGGLLKHVLTIAGSDTCGGAGIQADLKTFSAQGTYGMSVITAVTVQNTQGVFGCQDIDPEIIKGQIDAIFTDIEVSAVKIGMVSQIPTIHAIADKLAAMGVGERKMLCWTLL